MYYCPAAARRCPRLSTRRLLATTALFCRLYLRSSHYLHLLENGVTAERINIARTPGLARHTDNAEAIWSGLRTFCTLMLIGAWSIGAQWESGSGALTLAAISGVLYSAVATPFKSLSLLMRTLVLLSLFSFVVKFGLMVQISDLWQFILFLFPLLTTMQLLKLQMPAPQVFGAADCIYGFVYRGDQSAGI